MAEVRVLVESRNHLGEGPVWDAEGERLHWLDNTAGELWSCREDGGDVRVDYLPTYAGCMAIRRAGGAILALASGFAFYDFGTERFSHVLDPNRGDPGTRINDGKVDRRGRLVAGGMSWDHDLHDVNRTLPPVRNSALFRLDPDLSCHRLDAGIACSNGPCWSPDDRTLYFADSFERTLYAYDYCPETGAATGRRVFATAHDVAGTFDGATVDAEGGVWSAIVFGGKVVRYRPDGSVDRVVRMPVRNVTSVMFGGRDLDVLYVTSMGRPFRGLPQREPHAGCVFAVHGLGVRGLPEPRFGG